MSVVLNTQLGSLMFTSQIPDIDLTTSDDNEAVVMIVSGGTSIFSATHIPFAKSITVHDIRSVIEYYMRQGNHALRGFELRVKHNGNFLTTMEGKLTSPGATEFLYYHKPAFSKESVRLRVVASVYDEEPRVFQQIVQQAQSTIDTVARVEITHNKMLDAVEANGWVREHIKVLACSVQVGARAFTYYVQEAEPNLTLYFRNAFNCFECCELFAVTTHKPKVERQVAVTNRISTFYNQQNEKQYQVETSGLTMEQARLSRRAHGDQAHRLLAGLQSVGHAHHPDHGL